MNPITLFPSIGAVALTAGVAIGLAAGTPIHVQPLEVEPTPALDHTDNLGLKPISAVMLPRTLDGSANRTHNANVNAKRALRWVCGDMTPMQGAPHGKANGSAYGRVQRCEEM